MLLRLRSRCCKLTCMNKLFHVEILIEHNKFNVSERKLATRYSLLYYINILLYTYSTESIYPSVLVTAPTPVIVDHMGHIFSEGGHSETRQ